MTCNDKQSIISNRNTFCNTHKIGNEYGFARTNQEMIDNTGIYKIKFKIDQLYVWILNYGMELVFILISLDIHHIAAHMFRNKCSMFKCTFLKYWVLEEININIY